MSAEFYPDQGRHMVVMENQRTWRFQLISILNFSATEYQTRPMNDRLLKDAKFPPENLLTLVVWCQASHSSSGLLGFRVKKWLKLTGHL